MTTIHDMGIHYVIYRNYEFTLVLGRYEIRYFGADTGKELPIFKMPTNLKYAYTIQGAHRKARKGAHFLRGGSLDPLDEGVV